MPEPPSSLASKFLNNAARDHLKETKTYRVIQERVFDIPKLVRNPEFEAAIRAQWWELWNGMVFNKA